jgi:hypothetical protein
LDSHLRNNLFRPPLDVSAMSTDAKENSAQTSSPPLLWVGLFAGPTAFFLYLQVNYMLVPWACSTGHHFVLHLVMAAALLIATAGGISAWLCWQKAGRKWPDGSGGVLPRNRFLAVLGFLLSMFFFLIIIAQGIPNFILDPCQP